MGCSGRDWQRPGSLGDGGPDPHPAWLQEARMSRAAEVMVQHVENLKRHHMREHAELEEMKRLIQQNSRNRQLAEIQGEVGSAAGASAGFARSNPAGFGPEPLWGVSVTLHHRASGWCELRSGGGEQLMDGVAKGTADDSCEGTVEQQNSVGAGAGGRRAVTQLGMRGSGAPGTKRTLFLNTKPHTCHCCACDRSPCPGHHLCHTQSTWPGQLSVGGRFVTVCASAPS